MQTGSFLRELPEKDHGRNWIRRISHGLGARFSPVGTSKIPTGDPVRCLKNKNQFKP
jgi:hypothetical protein